MPYTLTKEFRFEASHQLPLHDGKCRRLHGHSWRGRIKVSRDTVDADGPKKGMSIDYSVLGWVCEELEEQLDHRHLNDVVDKEAPTSENVARWCYEFVVRHFTEDLSYKGVHLVSVTIEETCTTSCEYTGEAE